MPKEMPESECPHCKQELEIAEMRNPPGLSETKSGWFYFEDGSHVIGAKEAQPPRRCQRCRHQWLHHVSSGHIFELGF
jgi:predicted Zn-ribbon and HTH transcriptional regulator